MTRGKPIRISKETTAFLDSYKGKETYDQAIKKLWKEYTAAKAKLNRIQKEFTDLDDEILGSKKNLNNQPPSLLVDTE